MRLSVNSRAVSVAIETSNVESLLAASAEYDHRRIHVLLFPFYELYWKQPSDWCSSHSEKIGLGHELIF